MSAERVIKHTGGREFFEPSFSEGQSYVCGHKMVLLTHVTRAIFESPWPTYTACVEALLELALHNLLKCARWKVFSMNQWYINSPLPMLQMFSALDIHQYFNVGKSFWYVLHSNPMCCSTYNALQCLQLAKPEIKPLSLWKTLSLTRHAGPTRSLWQTFYQ